MKKSIDVKKAVKNIGYFLIVGTLVLAYFSPSVISFFIPKVSTAKPVHDSNLTRSVNITGIVKPKDVVPIKVNQAMVVEGIKLQSGSRVKKDQGIANVIVPKEIEGLSAISEIEGKLSLIDKEMQAYRIQKANLKANDLVQLADKIKAAEQKCDDNEVLFENGAIPASEVSSAKQFLESLIISENKVKEQIALIGINMEKLQDQVGSYNEKLASENYLVDDNFYVEDGELKSHFAGIIMELDEKAEVLEANATIGRFAIVDGFEDVYFEAKVPLDMSTDLRLNQQMRFVTEYRRKEYTVKITSKSYMVENDLIEIQGDFEGNNRIPVLFKEISGDASEYYTAGQKMKRNYETLVLKGCVRPKDGILEKGARASVFYVEEKSGVLGSEFYSTELEVTIEEVGDKYVAIAGYDRSEKLQFVQNITHKVSDGNRVLVEEK